MLHAHPDILNKIYIIPVHIIILPRTPALIKKRRHYQNDQEGKLPFSHGE
jgi:hypothetical protein